MSQLFKIFKISTKQKFLCFLFLITFHYSNSKTTDHSLLTISQDYIKSLILNSVNELRETLNETCTQLFESAFNHPNNSYLTKLLSDSSKNKRELGCQEDCQNIDYDSNITITSNLTYVVFTIEKPFDQTQVFAIDDLQTNSLIGVCIPKGCSDYDYKQIFLRINSKTAIFPELFGRSKEEENSLIHVYNIRTFESTILYFINFIPIILIAFFILCSFFNSIPVYIFYPFLYKRANDDVKGLISSCFVISDNSKELTNETAGDYLITMESGLSLLKGLRGFAILFFIISATFKQLYISPMRIYVKEMFVSLLKSYGFSIVIFGMRYAAKLCFAISSFMLIFKLIFYLDWELENPKQGEDERKEIEKMEKEFSDDVKRNSDSSNVLIKESLSDNDSNESEHNITKEEPEDNQSFQLSLSPALYNNLVQKISFKLLVDFILRQTYKYIMFILSVLFFKYSQYEPFAKFTSPGPIWLYFKEYIIDKFEIKHILSNIFLYSAYSSNTFNSFDPFMVIYNEITFFLLFSFLIFFSYKYNWRLDIIILCLIILVEIGKLAFFLLIDYYCEKSKFYPAMFFQQTGKSFILSNPLYNLPYGLIGMFFGLINYNFQSVSPVKSGKTFLKIPSLFRLCLFNSRTLSFIIAGFSLIAIVSLFLSFTFVISRYEGDLDVLFKNKGMNIFALYDVDLGIIFIFLFLIILFVMGDSVIVSFFQDNYWNLLSRPYFSFVIIVNVIFYFVFYQLESRIAIEMFNIIFFSVLILLLSIIGNFIWFIFIEIPMKKLNKVLVTAESWKKQKKISMSMSTLT